MYTKHNEDYTKLRKFSFIRQQQRQQPIFMNDNIRIFIHNKQPNIQTQPEQPKTRHQHGFHY